MSEVEGDYNNTVVEIAGKHLGANSTYSENYDYDLLVRVPRNLNREAYDIDETNLPFVGYDVWNAYEVSAITKSGRPVTGMMKISYPCDSKYHVESKSIKLYLNSFNMTRLGTTEEKCVSAIETMTSSDLSQLLECEVKCKLHRTVDYGAFSENNHIPFQGFINIETLTNLDHIEFNTYKSDASQLEVVDTKDGELTLLHSDLLRSNCRVTNQPDWGDVYIAMKAKKVVRPKNLLKYIVSFRDENHFHEEICETIYKRLWDTFEPKELAVTCLYARRGGIDINPTRVSHIDLLTDSLIDMDAPFSKTPRQ